MPIIPRIRNAIATQLVWQLLLPQLMFSLALASVGVFFIVKYTQDLMIQHLVQRGQFIEESVRQVAQRINSFATLQSYVEGLGRSPEVDLIIIVADNPLEVVASSDSALVGKKLTDLPVTDYQEDIDRVMKSGKPHFDPDQGGNTLFDYSAPISLAPLWRNYRELGAGGMMIHIRTEGAKRAIARTGQILSGILVLLVICSVALVALAVRKKILLPQAELLGSVRAREVGETAPVPIHGRNEIAQLSIAFNHLLATLDENERILLSQQAHLIKADKAKSEFLRNLSHEIRTPVGVILGFADLLAMDDLEATQKSMLDCLRHAGKDLQRMLEMVLDLAQLESNAMMLSISPSVLNDFSFSTQSQWAGVAAEKGLDLAIVLEGGLPEMVLIDGQRLRQVINLLIDNAIKFTDAGRVDVTLRRGRNLGAPDNVELELDVSDTGIGIKPEQVADIFESFVQGDGSVSRKVGGNGLGLALVKRLVALMGGEVHVVHRTEGGTTMRVHLPVAIETHP